MLLGYVIRWENEKVEKFISRHEEKAVKKMKRAIALANELYEKVDSGSTGYYGKGIAIATLAVKLFDHLDSSLEPKKDAQHSSGIEDTP